ncbi:DNA methyltransferase [Halorubrum sp. RMP-47]|uniref:DNA methyltransferase n=1 Tax=Halorubrum miltondacostae TaxID=3076378 RepID=UPI0035274CC4
MSSETCDSAVELEMLASGMAKQHETYLDALQELIDNSVAASVDDESYFENPDEEVTLSLTFVRGEDTVTTYISDNGPGITREQLQNHVFRTGNKEISDGILNNVGWGLKASLAWFEESLKQRKLQSDTNQFTLITQTKTSDCLRVDGPITGDLPISSGSQNDWEIGIPEKISELNQADHGTRVHATCARAQFDNDVWPSADSLDKKVQYVRERLGTLFRRLLSAREDNRIVVSYHDLETNERGCFDVIPIWPRYSDETQKKSHEFEVITPRDEQYRVEYESGTLDIDAMTDRVEKEYPGLLTQSGKFRYRYRPSQNRQGVDIYANGRVLMTSVFEEVFDLTRNNQYNYFGGTIQIIPIGDTKEVPTDNKKTRLDTNSELWREIQSELSTEEFLPEGREYGKRISTGGASGEDTTQGEDAPTETRNQSTTIDSDSNVFGLHNADVRSAISELRTYQENTTESDEQLLNTTVTSPPYYDLKEYGSDDDDEVGQHGSYVEYLNELREVFGDIYKLTKQDGSLWVVVNTFRRNREIVQLPFDIARVCQNLDHGIECPSCESTLLGGVDMVEGRKANCPHCGHSIQNNNSWILQDIVVWNKNKALPYTKQGRLRNVFEYILCFSKNPDFDLKMDRIRESHPDNFKQWWADFPERYHPRGKLPENIWEFEPPTRGSFTGDVDVFDHPAAFPPALVERILTLSTDPGDVVLDPFAGSGVTIAQAELMERNGIGIELNEKYCNSYPELQEHLKKQHERAEETTTQDDLDRLICGLRQTKYARELVRTLAGELGLSNPAQLDVHTIFLVSRELGYQSVAPDTHGQVDIVLIVDEETTARDALTYHETAEEVTTMRPCSGFGVKARPIVLTTDEFTTEVADGTYTHLPDDLFVYEDGRHYVYTETTTFSEWKSMTHNSAEWTQRYAGDETPPVVTNLGLEINHPKQSMDTISRPLSGNHEFQLTQPSGKSIESVIKSK